MLSFPRRHQRHRKKDTLADCQGWSKGQRRLGEEVQGGAPSSDQVLVFLISPVRQANRLSLGVELLEHGTSTGDLLQVHSAEQGVRL